MSATGSLTCGKNRYHSAIADHHTEPPSPPRRRLTSVALVYYFYYVRGLMDVGLNSGQLALRDSVRDVLRTECPPGVARQAMTDPERWRTIWKTVVDLGWTELAAPAHGGGGALRRVDLPCGRRERGSPRPPTAATARAAASTSLSFSRNAVRPSPPSPCCPASDWPQVSCASPAPRLTTCCVPSAAAPWARWPLPP